MSVLRFVCMCVFVDFKCVFRILVCCCVCVCVSDFPLLFCWFSVYRKVITSNMVIDDSLNSSSSLLFLSLLLTLLLLSVSPLSSQKISFFLSVSRLLYRSTSRHAS